MSNNAAPGHVSSLPIQAAPAAADHPCTEMLGCVVDHSDLNSYIVPCNQFDHHGPKHTILGPGADPVLTVRRTKLSEEGCEPIIEGWGHGADLEMNQNEARSFAAQLRQAADRIDEEAERLADVADPRPSVDLPARLQDGECDVHPWCLRGATVHEDCQGAEISLESPHHRLDRQGPGGGAPYLGASLATYDGTPMAGMLLEDWTDLDAAGLRRVIGDIEKHLPNLRILAAQLAVAETKSSDSRRRAA